MCHFVFSLTCNCRSGKQGEMCPDKAKVMLMYYPQALEEAMGIRRLCDGPTVGAAVSGTGGAEAGGVASAGPAVAPPASQRAEAGPYTHSSVSEPLRASREHPSKVLKLI